MDCGGGADRTGPRLDSRRKPGLLPLVNSGGGTIKRSRPGLRRLVPPVSPMRIPPTRKDRLLPFLHVLSGLTYFCPLMVHIHVYVQHCCSTMQHLVRLSHLLPPLYDLSAAPSAPTQRTCPPKQPPSDPAHIALLTVCRVPWPAVVGLQ